MGDAGVKLTPRGARASCYCHGLLLPQARLVPSTGRARADGHLERPKELAEAHAQRREDGGQGVYRDAGVAALKASHVGAVNAGHLGQLLLRRHPCPDPKLP